MTILFHYSHIFIMKKTTLLIISCILFLTETGCFKDPAPEPFISEDEALAGETVTAGDSESPFYKLFVLNEGGFGKNNASLDFLRFSDGRYVRSAFKQMNTESVPQGLGDVGNDIKIYYNTAWIAVNNSNLVEVIEAYSEKHRATLAIPSPRQIAFTEQYGYVSSYAGAYFGGPARRGAVYKVDMRSLQVVGKVDVGYQPEGMTVYGGKLFVANSGGLNGGAYESHLSVIDLASFTVVDSLAVATEAPVLNLQQVYSDGRGHLWLTAFGDFATQHSGVYKLDLATGKTEQAAGVFASSAVSYNPDAHELLVIGSQDEWVWSGPRKQTFTSIRTDTGKVTQKDFSELDFAQIQTPYAILPNPANGDIYIGDAGDFLAPGYLWCFSAGGKFRWKALAGIAPGHLALYALI